MRRKKLDAYVYVRMFLLIIFAVVAIAPFLVLPLISLKTKSEFLREPLALPKVLDFENYIEVFERAKILKTFFNSLFIMVGTLVVEIFAGSLAAYGITKMNYKHANKFSLAFMIPMIFPVQSITVPLYLIFRKLELLNTFTGLILIDAAIGLPVVIFIMTSFMKTVPIQISESAFVDGAGHFTVFMKIIFPLLKPVVSTIIVISGLGIWNDFYMPMVMITDQSKKTLPLKIYDFMGQYSNDWTLVCTCIIFVILPIIVLYCIMQRHIISGVIAGSVKG